jgi:hypothetical protein
MSAACLSATGCAAADPLAGMSAQQVMTKAADNLENARGVTMTGTVDQGSAGSYGVNLRFSRSQGCAGTYSYLTKGAVAFVQTSAGTYLQPDSTWWTAGTGTSGYRIDSLVAGRYLKQSTATSAADFCTMLTAVQSPQAPGSVTKGPLTTFDGTRALELLLGSHGYVEYVSDASDPEILGASSPKGNEFVYDVEVNVGAPVTLAVPPASQALDASDFGFTQGLASQRTVDALSNAMITSAFDNLHGVPSTTVSGFAKGGGVSFTLNLAVKGKKDCEGTIDYGSKGSLKVVVIAPDVYFDPDDAFWQTSAGPGVDPTPIIDLVHGRYIHSTTSDPNAKDIAGLCGLVQAMGPGTSLPSGVMAAAMIRRAAGGAASGGTTVGKLITVNGVKALPISQDGDTVDLSETAGKLEVVRVNENDSAGVGTLTFNPGAPVTLTAPPASDVIEASAIGS